MLRRVGRIVVAAGVLMLAVAGCGREEEDSGVNAPPAAAQAPTVEQPPAAPATQSAPRTRIVFIGDSLTAGLGVEAVQAFPAVLGAALEREGLAVQVVNAGVSGDTTAGGLRRLGWVLRQKPDLVVVGLGANDGLRGLDLQASEANLRAIVRQSKAAGADLLLLGMLIPPNYGPEYTGQFRDLYPRLARELDVGLVPFALDRVGGEPRLNQSDGIHPTPEGHRIIADNVLPHLRPAVRRLATAATTRPAPGG